MERRFAIILFTFTLFISKIYPQEYSTDKIRLYLWALKDSYPEIKEEKPFEQAKNHLINLSEFLLCGMTYGWQFSYTPSDKLRGVSEYFECKPLTSFENDKKNIEYDKTHFTEDKIFCWVNFNRTEQMKLIYKQFSNIKNPRVIGTGKDKLFKGFTGLENAIYNSVKDAVREYYRKIIKNKPKEIIGNLLIKKIPAIYIEAGNYVVELDFFLETSKIKEYSQF